MTEKLLQRFLTYVQYNTQSQEGSLSFPSTASQMDFAKLLVQECEMLGLKDVQLDNYGYVMATLPATTDKPLPTIGFIAHMDTSPDCSGNQVKPRLVTYSGGDLFLDAAHSYCLSPQDFPILDTLVGETLIVTDGTTLLGADDKCGIAEILTAMEYLLSHPEIPHGTIRIAFTPDEEIGHGADHFDVARFGADFAYTVDGGELGECEIENFYAASAKIICKGRNIHPGYAKGKMKNSLTIANAFHALLPVHEVPECTSDYEGFFHLHHMEGTVEQTTLSYIIRDFDQDSFEKRKIFLYQIATQLQAIYGKEAVTVLITNQYNNMRTIIEKHPHVLALAKKAMAHLEIPIKKVPIRGGTDGARLSFMGLPCPNLFTGGYNFHSHLEFAVLSHMEAATQTLLQIIRLSALE
ncbi:peptidase T [Sporanaerobium hydrogeniformans]|uniref:Peptidase T n=1 Tax=Sporanaerobium hydrogeniformans TaxID=3072179 RepID=A0AC61DGA9_9FIRM|nr:peptidase T [Sporanaerobium hydrogeniformans]PHV71462.1 peptidase T [Sporanaerobium hydrogeniformans]